MVNLETKHKKLKAEIANFLDRLEKRKEEDGLDLNMNEVQQEVSHILSELKIFEGTDYVEDIMQNLQLVVDKIDEVSQVYEDFKETAQGELSKTTEKKVAHQAYLKAQYN